MEKGGITLQDSKQVFELTKTSYPSDQVSDYNQTMSHDLVRIDVPQVYSHCM